MQQTFQQSKFLQQITNLEKRIDCLERSRASPEDEFIPFSEAARLCGKTKKGFSRWLQRDGDNPDGCHPRRIRGAVHRGDLLKMLKKKRLVPRGEKVRVALEGLI